MNNLNLAQELSSIKNILQASTIGIILGEGLNQDTAAAGLSLYLSLKEAGKNVQIVSKKEPFVEIANLVGINKLKKTFSGESSKVVVSLPYIKGEIGKVSYKEEDNRINFYLTAVEGKSISSYENSDINLIWDSATPSVVFAIGMNSAASLSEFVDSNSNVKVITMDRLGEGFGDVNLVNNSFSSVSEIAAKVIKDLSLPINIDIAQNLLDGIVYATKNFTRTNTSPLAFEQAGVMMLNGAVRVERGMPRSPQPQNQNRRPQNAFQQSNQNSSNRPNFRDQNRPRPDEDVKSTQPINQNTSGMSAQSTSQDKEAQFVAPQEEPKNTEVNEIVESATNGQLASEDNDIPSDWLMPKVFKGSQNIDDLK